MLRLLDIGGRIGVAFGCDNWLGREEGLAMVLGKEIRVPGETVGLVTTCDVVIGIESNLRRVLRLLRLLTSLVRGLKRRSRVGLKVWAGWKRMSMWVQSRMII